MSFFEKVERFATLKEQDCTRSILHPDFSYSFKTHPSFLKGIFYKLKKQPYQEASTTLRNNSLNSVILYLFENIKLHAEAIFKSSQKRKSLLTCVFRIQEKWEKDQGEGKYSDCLNSPLFALISRIYNCFPVRDIRKISYLKAEIYTMMHQFHKSNFSEIQEIEALIHRDLKPDSIENVKIHLETLLRISYLFDLKQFLSYEPLMDYFSETLLAMYKLRMKQEEGCLLLKGRYIYPDSHFLKYFILQLQFHWISKQDFFHKNHENCIGEIFQEILSMSDFLSTFSDFIDKKLFEKKIVHFLGFVSHLLPELFDQREIEGIFAAGVFYLPISKILQHSKDPFSLTPLFKREGDEVILEKKWGDLIKISKDTIDDFLIAAYDYLSDSEFEWMHEWVICRLQTNPLFSTCVFLNSKNEFFREEFSNYFSKDEAFAKQVRESIQLHVLPTSLEKYPKAFELFIQLLKKAKLSENQQILMAGYSILSNFFPYYLGFQIVSAGKKISWESSCLAPTLPCLELDDRDLEIILEKIDEGFTESRRMVFDCSYFPKITFRTLNHLLIKFPNIKILNAANIEKLSDIEILIEGKSQLYVHSLVLKRFDFFNSLLFSKFKESEFKNNRIFLLEEEMYHFLLHWLDFVYCKMKREDFLPPETLLRHLSISIYLQNASLIHEIDSQLFNVLKSKAQEDIEELVINHLCKESLGPNENISSEEIESFVSQFRNLNVYTILQK